MKTNINYILATGILAITTIPTGFAMGGMSMDNMQSQKSMSVSMTGSGMEQNKMSHNSMTGSGMKMDNDKMKNMSSSMMGSDMIMKDMMTKEKKMKMINMMKGFFRSDLTADEKTKLKDILNSHFNLNSMSSMDEQKNFMDSLLPFIVNSKKADLSKMIENKMNMKKDKDMDKGDMMGNGEIMKDDMGSESHSGSMSGTGMDSKHNIMKLDEKTIMIVKEKIKGFDTKRIEIIIKKIDDLISNTTNQNKINKLNELRDIIKEK